MMNRFLGVRGFGTMRFVAGNGKCLFYFVRMVWMYEGKWNWGKAICILLNYNLFICFMYDVVCCGVGGGATRWMIAYMYMVLE